MRLWMRLSERSWRHCGQGRHDQGEDANHFQLLLPVDSYQADSCLHELGLRYSPGKLEAYPRLTGDDIHAAMRYAADALAHEEVVFICRWTPHGGSCSDPVSE
jgi:hypothetical protein